jgi:hypothetical protein
VTGTNIRGAAPAGQKLIVIDKKEIDRSGFATAQRRRGRWRAISSPRCRRKRARHS